MASAKVKMVLVHGNYDGTTKEEGEFERNIVVTWGKKKKLLQGHVEVYLKNGSATVGEIRIQHDKHPIRNVEFRLGAMVVDCPFEVKQAITQPFIVKDRRNAPKTFRSLSLTDKVWQLTNISKYGKIHRRLESSNVCTVMDFLTMYNSNRRALQEIYGVKGRKWETTVRHAKTCNAGNAPVRLGSTSEGSNTMSAFDDDASNEFDMDCYFPQPCGNNPYCNEMIMDKNFSIQDVDQECYMDVWFQESLPHQASGDDGISGASSMAGHDRVGKGVKAKKRWMKMRTLWFSIVSFNFLNVGVRST
ncbi:hypothetical protein L1887_26227 [Cichorium endivia]|nr:hypothetical protein L1887_26227 [Cichorium endivia]